MSDTPYDLPTRYIWGTVEYPALRYNAWWEVGNAQEKAVANFLYHVLLDDLWWQVIVSQLCVAKLDNSRALDALCPLNYKLNTNSRFSQWHQLACTRNTIFLYSFLEIPSAETVSNFQITFFPYSRWTNDFSPGPDRSNDV